MCLYADILDSELIAEEDIICYKVLYFVDGKYVSPYRRTDYTEYINNFGKIFEDPTEIKRYYDLLPVDIIVYDKGFVHFYTTYRVAEIFKSCVIDSRIFKCIIPKGTIYTIGKYDDICAKKFKFVEEITELI